MGYAIAFSGPEHATRKAAVAAGVGIMLMPERVISRDMVIAREACLPKPPAIRTGLFAREGLDLGSIKPLVRALEKVLRPRDAQELRVDPPRRGTQRKRALRRQPA